MQRIGRQRTLQTTSLAVLALALSACNGCSERKPYTPFTLDGGALLPSASAATSPTVSSTGFVPVVATNAPSADAFPLDPGTVPAPSGRAFVSGVSVDADGDGTLDLFAWVETRDKKQNELWFVRGNDRAGHGTTLATPPADLGDPSCKRDLKLAQIGAMTVMAEVDARCSEQKVHRWFAVIRLHNSGPRSADDHGQRADAREPELRLEGRLGPASPGESFDLAFSADDRDADKIDDLKVDLTLDGVAEPYEASGKITLPILLVDRPAGFARDPSEPDATLAKTAAQLVAKARVSKTAGDVPGAAAQLLRAATIVCDGLGTTALSTSAGALRCGDNHFIGDAMYAIGVAGITKGDFAQALSARAALGNVKPSADKHIKDLDSALAKAAPIVDAAIVWRSATAPARGGVLSPLTFDADGNLLVVGETSVSRVAASDFAETKSDAIAWPRAIAWQSSGTEFALLGAARRCDPPEIVLKAKVSGGPTEALLPTVWSMLPKGAKSSTCREADLGLAPLVTEGSGSLVAIGTDVIRIESSGSGVVARRAQLPDGNKGPPSLPGSSRSPDGSAVALTLGPDSSDVLVVTSKTARRWHSDDLRDVTTCVPENGGAHVACLTKSGAVLVAPR